METKEGSKPMKLVVTANAFSLSVIDANVGLLSLPTKHYEVEWS
jgi:hypothetical protein